MTDVFISYSSDNLDFVQRLTDALIKKGKETWFDKQKVPLRGIPDASEWWREILEGIQAADNFLFVISPSSVISPYCNGEIVHALKHNKRKITILLCESDSDTARADARAAVREAIEAIPKDALMPDGIKTPEKRLRELARQNWQEISGVRGVQYIVFPATGDFSELLKRLLVALDTDLEWVRAQNHLQQKTFKWEQNQRHRSFLLRGRELEEAEAWLAQATDKKPQPTPLQLAYVAESRKDQARQQRVRLSAALILAGLAIVFGIQSHLNARKAEQQTIRVKNLAIIEQANQVLQQHNPDLALALAKNATGGEDPPEKAYATLLDAAYRSLSRACFTVCEQNNSGSAWVTAVDISPDDREVAVGCSADDSSKIYVLDSQTGEMKAKWQHPAWILSLAFSPDGQSILAGYSDAKAILWERNGISKLTLTGHTGAVSAVAFSPDGATATTASHDKSIMTWDLNTGTNLQHIIGAGEANFPGRFTSLDYSPDGEKIVLGDDVGNVIVWIRKERAIFLPTSGEKHSHFVLDVEFSPDGSQIISSAADSTIAIWDFDGLLSKVGTLDVSEHYPGVWVHSAKFLPDGTKLLATLSDGTILLWDVRSRQLIQTLEGHLSEVQSLSVSSDGSFAISGARDGSIRLWDLQTFQAIDTMRAPNTSQQNTEMNSMVFARDSPRMFSGSANGFVYLWDANSRQMLANWAAYPDYVSIPEIALTPDETRLLTAGSDGKAILWDLGKYYPIWQFSKYGDSVRSVDIDPDPDPDEKTNNLILGYASGEIILVNLETGEPICTLNGHTNSVNSVRFSPDGKTAISGSNDYTVIKWDVSTCTKVTTLFRHDSWVMALAFSPDGRLVGSASADGTTILWDLEADRQVYRLRLPEIGINPGLDALGLSLDFSPDGRLLATGSANGSVAIWSVENGILLRKWIAYPAESCEYGVHCFWVLSTKFSRSGYEVWTSSADGMVRVWSLIQASDISELREWLVQNRHAHELTAQEKDAYDIGE